MFNESRILRYCLVIESQRGSEGEVLRPQGQGVLGTEPQAFGDLGDLLPK